MLTIVAKTAVIKKPGLTGLMLFLVIRYNYPRVLLSSDHLVKSREI